MNYINNALLSAREVAIAKIFKKTGYDEPKTLVYLLYSRFGPGQEDTQSYHERERK